MKQLIYILLCMLSVNGYAQDWYEDTVKIKGPVKTVNYTRTAFISEDENDWWRMNNYYQYNKNGFLVKSNVTGDMDGEFQSGIYRIFNKTEDNCLIEFAINEGDTISKRLFIYDSLNRIIKSDYYSDNEYWSSVYFTYNSSNLLLEKLAITARNDSLWDKYEYDSENRLIEYVDSSKSLYKVKTWRFDSSDRLIELKSQKLRAPKPYYVKMGNNGEILDEKRVDRLPKDDDHSVITYHYNDSNKVIREIKKYLDSDEGNEKFYVYNEHGDISSYTIIDLKTKESHKSSNEYVYDENGNWIINRYYWDGELDEKETRNIEYY